MGGMMIQKGSACARGCSHKGGGNDVARGNDSPKEE